MPPVVTVDGTVVVGGLSLSLTVRAIAVVTAVTSAAKPVKMPGIVVQNAVVQNAGFSELFAITVTLKWDKRPVQPHAPR